MTGPGPIPAPGENREGLWSLPAGYRMVLAAFLALFLAVNLATLQDGHSWEFDDFGQYLAHARNLAQGRPYQEGILLAPSPANPTAYPPVYPLLLAPVLAALGLNFIALKAVNLGLWVLLASPIFRVARRYLSRRTAFLLTLFALSLPFSFYFKQRLYSDPAFLLCALWGLVIFQDYLDRGGGGRLAGALVMMTLAMLTRAAGASLFVAAFIWLLAVERRPKPAWLFAVLPAAVLAAGLALLDPSGLGYLDQLPTSDAWLHGSLRNIHRMLWHLFEGLAPRPLSLADEKYYLVPMVVVGLALLAAVLQRIWQRETDFHLFFGLVYLLLNIAWPFSPTARSMVLVGPLAMALIVNGLGLGLSLVGARRPGQRERVFTVLLLAGLVYNAVFTGLIFDYNENDTGRPETRRMLNWLEQNTGPDEHYVHSAARVVSLLSGRTGLALPPNRERLLEVMDRHRVKLVIIKLPEDRAAREWLRGAGDFRLEWADQGWEIYRRGAPAGRGALPGALLLLGRRAAAAQSLLRTGMPASQGTLVWHRPQP